MELKPHAGTTSLDGARLTRSRSIGPISKCSWHFPPEAFKLDDFDPACAVDFWDITNREGGRHASR